MENTIEQELKDFILSRYKSVREFAISAKIPTSTLATIFDRGVRSANINTIFQICDALFLDIDGLMVNKIVEKQSLQSALDTKENTLIIAKGGKRTMYELAEEQLQIIVDMAEALAKK